MRKIVHALLLTSALVASAVLGGCLADGEDGSSSSGPTVIATFYPIGFLAERIAGDNVSVEILLGPGVEPHDFEPTVRDATRIASADLVLAQGLGFEPWFDGLVENIGGDAPPVVKTAERLDLDALHDDHDDHDAHADDHDHDHDTHETHEEDADAHAGEHDDHDHAGEHDPHTWLDPVLFAEQARVVQAALAEAFPEHATAFEARADALVADLGALDADFEAALADCGTRHVVVNHNAFAYVSERYDFTIHAVYGLAPQSEPDARTMDRLVKIVREHDLPIVFHEELVSPRVAEVIAEETGAEVRVLSPVEGLTPEAAERGEDYLSLMRANLANLSEAMKCE